MNYPFTDADWLVNYLPETNLYRKVKAGFLTLGHLRTAEALGVHFFCGLEPSTLDWGILVTLSQTTWQKALKRASNPSVLWAWKRDRNTPKNVDELRSCIKWWKSQNYHPTRTLMQREECERLEEVTQKATNRASTSIERLAMSLCRIEGWQTLSRCECVWDIPMVTATHLLISNAELEGAYHIPYDLIRMARNG